MSDDETIILCCMPVDGPLIITDNLTGQCDSCGVTVQFRPHAPQNCILRCVSCVLDLIKPDDLIGTTPEMLEDVKKYFANKKH